MRMVVSLSNTDKIIVAATLAFAFLLSSCTVKKPSILECSRKETQQTFTATTFESKQESKQITENDMQLRAVKISSAILKKDNFHCLEKNYPGFDIATHQSELVGADGRVMSETDLFKMNSKAQEFCLNGKLLKVSTCYLEPIALLPYFSAIVKFQINVAFQQLALPAVIKQFMQENYGYKDRLPGSLAYLVYNNKPVCEKRTHSVSFIPRAYKIEYDGETYYALKAIQMAYPQALLAKERGLKIDEAVELPANIVDSYCDGVYNRFSYIAK